MRFPHDYHLVNHLLVRTWRLLGTELQLHPIEFTTCLAHTGSSTEQGASYAQVNQGSKIQLLVHLSGIISFSQLLPSGLSGL